MEELKLKTELGNKKIIGDGMMVHPPEDENMLFILRYGWNNEGLYGWYLEAEEKHYPFDKSVKNYIITGEGY